MTTASKDSKPATGATAATGFMLDSMHLALTSMGLAAAVAHVTPAALRWNVAYAAFLVHTLGSAMLFLVLARQRAKNEGKSDPWGVQLLVVLAVGAVPAWRHAHLVATDASLDLVTDLRALSLIYVAVVDLLLLLHVRYVANSDDLDGSDAWWRALFVMALPLHVALAELWASQVPSWCFAAVYVPCFITIAVLLALRSRWRK